jgi:hypothetical protein
MSFVRISKLRLLESFSSSSSQSPWLVLTHTQKPFTGYGDTPHSWGKSRKGKNVVRQTTAKSRFARSPAAVKDWCRTNRHRPAREQHAWSSAVLNGHYAYYGITGNYRRPQEYRHQVVRI